MGKVRFFIKQMPDVAAGSFARRFPHLARRSSEITRTVSAMSSKPMGKMNEA